MYEHFTDSQLCLARMRHRLTLPHWMVPTSSVFLILHVGDKLFNLVRSTFAELKDTFYFVEVTLVDGKMVPVVHEETHDAVHQPRYSYLVPTSRTSQGVFDTMNGWAITFADEGSPKTQLR